MKYRFIQRHGSGFEVKKMCRVLRVSRSGYYSYLRRGISPRHQENVWLATKIKDVWEENRRVYGSPRITAELCDQGIRVGENRIARLMRKHDIKAVTKKRFRVTTDSDHTFHQAEDLLDGDFSVTTPNEIWLSDITYIWTWEGWMYLAAVMEVFNREIIGWSLRNNLKKELVTSALRKALLKRSPKSGLIFHSDRGSQYGSKEMVKILNAWDIRQSMSKSCYKNAMMESFFGSLETELVLTETFHTRACAKKSIFEYIEMFYNRHRRHSALNYLSPLEYYKQASQTF